MIPVYSRSKRDQPFPRIPSHLHAFLVTLVPKRDRFYIRTITGCIPSDRASAMAMRLPSAESTR